MKAESTCWAVRVVDLDPIPRNCIYRQILTGGPLPSLGVNLSADVVSDKAGRITNVEEENDPRLQRFADEYDTALLAFVGSYVPRRYGPLQFASSEMSIPDEFSVEEALTRMAGGREGPRKLYLLVNSLGGSPSSAYKIAMAIRKSYDDVTVFVPHIAASGGTLLALIGSKIRMGMMSQLSPVDIQVWYKNTFVSTNSMLAAKQSLDKTLSMKSVDELTYLERHLADSFDPTVMEEFNRTANMGVVYLDTILKATGYDEPKRETIIKKLIFSLPVHGFVVDGDLAGNIGIKVEDGNANVEEWKMMRNWCLKYINQAEDKHFVRYVVPKKNGG